MGNENTKAAQELDHKLGFYLVALSFTVAGFAIQTGNFRGHRIADSAEVTAWILLVTSGLFGLWRIEWLPVAYRNFDWMRTLEKAAEEYIVDDEESAKKASSYSDDAKNINSLLEKIEGGNRRKYLAQKCLFAAGMVSLLVARYFSGLASLR